MLKIAHIRKETDEAALVRETAIRFINNHIKRMQKKQNASRENGTQPGVGQTDIRVNSNLNK